MPLGSLRHPFSDTVADIDGVSVRTRLASGTSCGGGSTAGRRVFTGLSTTPTTTSSTAAQPVDEKLPLRGFDADQPRYTSSSTPPAVAGPSRTWSQRQKPSSSRSPPVDLTETPPPPAPRRSSPTTIHAEPPRTPPRPLCVIDCCCCCAGSLLISWLKVACNFNPLTPTIAVWVCLVCQSGLSRRL